MDLKSDSTTSLIDSKRNFWKLWSFRHRVERAFTNCTTFKN